MFYYLKLPDDDLAFHNVEAIGLSKGRESAILMMLDVAAALTLQAPSPDRDARYAAFKAQAIQMTAGITLQRQEDGDPGPVSIDLTRATYACAWDGQTPYVITLFGDFPGAVPFAGWPQTDVPPAPVVLTDEQVAQAAAAATARAQRIEAWLAGSRAAAAISDAALDAWSAANPYPT